MTVLHGLRLTSHAVTLYGHQFVRCLCQRRTDRVGLAQIFRNRRLGELTSSAANWLVYWISIALDGTKLETRQKRVQMRRSCSDLSRDDSATGRGRTIS